MNISLQVGYRLKDDGAALCFRHAIHAALAGNNIKTEIYSLDDESYSLCHICSSGDFKESFRQPCVYEGPDYDDDDPDNDHRELVLKNTRLFVEEASRKPINEKKRDLITKGFHLRKKSGNKKD
jgi:hypothetical protein